MTPMSSIFTISSSIARIVWYHIQRVLYALSMETSSGSGSVQPFLRLIRLFMLPMKDVFFLMPASFSCLCGLLSFMSLGTWFFIVFSLSELKYSLITFLFKYSYCTFYIVVSNSYLHVWTATPFSLSIKLVFLLRLECAQEAALILLPLAKCSSYWKAPHVPSYSKVSWYIFSFIYYTQNK